MRVITGSARGRRLRELEGMETRPTTDRVKEGMFSILQFDIEGRRVLDLFAGTGQLPKSFQCEFTLFVYYSLYLPINQALYYFYRKSGNANALPLKFIY